MDGTFRRELARSVRLFVDEELWLLAGLAGGGAGYLVWLAGTGVAVARAVEGIVGEATLEPWSSNATTLAATFVLLWVIVPAAVAVWYVVGNLTNLRGNIERCYRLEEPITLIVPPLGLLVVAVLAAAVSGTLSPAVLVLIGVANSLLLVRTVAYGYRVYSLSVPRMLHVLVFVAAATVCLAIISRTGSMTDQTALIEATAEQYGVYHLAFGTTTWGGVTVATLPLLGAAMPGLLALGYVWVQIFASLLVRIRRPNVPRSAIRPGQRYPAVVKPGNDRRLAMGTGDDGSSGGSAGPSSGESTPPTQSTSDGGTADAGADADGGEAEGDRIRHTRVYTPPDDDQVEGETTVDAEKSEQCPICGTSYQADPERTHCPNCNAILDEE